MSYATEARRHAIKARRLARLAGFLACVSVLGALVNVSTALGVWR